MPGTVIGSRYPRRNCILFFARGGSLCDVIVTPSSIGYIKVYTLAVKL